MPGHSKNRTELTNQFLDELWNSLPHPPLSWVPLPISSYAQLIF